MLFCSIELFTHSECASPKQLVKEFFYDSAYYGYGEGSENPFDKNYVQNKKYHPLDKYFKDKNYLNKTLPYSVDMYMRQMFDSYWYPFMFVSDLELNEEEFGDDDDIVISAKFKTQHLYFDGFIELKYLEIKDKESVDKKRLKGKNKVEILNELFSNMHKFFANYFDKGNILKKDFYEECEYFIKNIRLDKIYAKGAVLLVKTTEKHYFYLKRYNNKWRIVKIKRELLDYELDLS